MTLEDLAATIADRAGADPTTSWTARLLWEPELAAKKFGEEAIEAVIEAVADTNRLTAEAADALYHLLVMCAARGVTLADIEAELEARSHRSGLAEKADREG